MKAVFSTGSPLPPPLSRRRRRAGDLATPSLPTARDAFLGLLRWNGPSSPAPAGRFPRPTDPPASRWGPDYSIKFSWAARVYRYCWVNCCCVTTYAVSATTTVSTTTVYYYCVTTTVSLPLLCHYYCVTTTAMSTTM